MDFLSRIFKNKISHNSGIDIEVIRTGFIFIFFYEQILSI